MIETSLSQSDPMPLPERPLGDVARSVLGYSLLTALMILTPMVVFVPTALLHCAIRNGRRAAWATLAATFTIAAILAVVFPTLGAQDVLFMFFAIAVPTIAVLPLVQRGENLGRVLVLMLLVSAAGLLVNEVGSQQLLSVSPYAEQVTQTRQMNTKIVEFYRANGMDAASLKRGADMFERGVILLPAAMLMSVALFFLLSLLMLGRLKVWRDLSARRPDESLTGAFLFRNFRLPEWLLFAFVAGGLAPLLTGGLQKIAANVLALTVFLYVVQGLAIFRFLLTAVGVGLAGTLAAMALMGCLTFTLVPPLLLGVTGLFDPFFDFRHFKKRKDDSNESHSD